MEFNSLPIDIISFCILPNLYTKNILKDYFKGDPETGHLCLKDAWDAPHLSIINQLKNIKELSKVNVELSTLVKHPFDINFKEKLDFARQSITDIVFTNRIRKKIIYKIANRIKPKNVDKIIEIIECDFQKRIKYNKILLHQEMKEKFEPRPYHFSNDNCLNCFGVLPLYYPSIRKNWNRCIKDGYNPHFIRKRFCSKRCCKKSLSNFTCAKCEKKCIPGTDFKHNHIACSFTLMLVNPETSESSEPKYIASAYSSDFTCSMKCMAKINDFHKEFDGKNILIRSNIIPIVYGFVIDNDTLAELQGTTYVTKDIVRILNPQAEEFNANGVDE
jgi:hypothetical protein